MEHLMVTLLSVHAIYPCSYTLSRQKMEKTTASADSSSKSWKYLTVPTYTICSKVTVWWLCSESVCT